MINTLDDFKKKYLEICNMGWIKTHRSGPTGIGKTLEDLLDIKENNINGPDFGDYELKSCRIKSDSMLTIFTKAPLPKGVISLLRLAFGYSFHYVYNDDKILHATLSANKFTKIENTGRSLKISCFPSKICIIADDNIERAYWMKEDLKNVFEKKYKSKLIYAKAESRGNGEKEEFHFVEAYELSGFNYDNFVYLLEQGKIYIDLRIGMYGDGPKQGQTHDHGTAFRIKNDDLQLLFTICNQII